MLSMIGCEQSCTTSRSWGCLICSFRCGASSAFREMRARAAFHLSPNSLSSARVEACRNFFAAEEDLQDLPRRDIPQHGAIASQSHLSRAHAPSIVKLIG